MRIFFITHVDLKTHSGNARHVLALSRALQQLGHELTVFAPGHPLNESFRHLCPHTPPGITLGPGWTFELWLLQAVFKAAQHHRPDFAYIRLAPSTLLVPTLLRQLHIPYGFELNGPIFTQLTEAGRPEFLIRRIKNRMQKDAQKARFIVVPTRVKQNYVAAEFDQTAVLIENGVELSTAQVGDRQAARAKLQLPPHLPLVCFVGHLVPVLRFDLFEMARNELEDIGFVFVGGGQQAAALQRLTATTSPKTPIFNLGPQPHEHAVLAIQAADVCLNLNDQDITLKNLEYAALGRRQVSFALPGIESLQTFYPQLEALFVAEPNGHSLAVKIRQALATEKSRGPLPAAAVEAVRRQLGWQHKAEALCALIKQSIGR